MLRVQVFGVKASGALQLGSRAVASRAFRVSLNPNSLKP